MGLFLAIAVAGAAAARSSAPAGEPRLDEQALRARYGLPASRFMDIDGTPIHYVDEGQGPVIVLVHGSYASLRQWNNWADILRRRYRVIRFDQPPAGLSGPSPSADYGVDLTLRVIDTLTRRLGADRFLLVSTSSGSVPAVAYAALHPDRVIGMIFGDAAVGPLHLDPAALTPALREALAEDATHKDFHTPNFWRQILLYNIDDTAKVTDDLVREWTDLNNRVLRMPHEPPTLVDRTADDLRGIHMPTLLLWGADDREVSVAEHARKGLALIPGTDKQLIVMPGCGHMLPLDCGDAALEQARPFIDRVMGAEHPEGR
ncbi:alpha/beta hydrolase [Nitrospirillum sp. BR 11828]|uniref:alpha/beta fold hydrolase n=1 Tax=Nitrospirillum sp. BR 11828 TaxID=3104325 RepID=UPI002ACA0F5B|nr:alpha/beta hydrolase [Nitrospirillum sp. BR 11828]MDZ5648161.1 alpha/beta hydrolase [Nitrospirillum sp. BR 11828]